MVHISALRSGGVRVNHPREVVTRGQKVKVKVMTVAGNRIGLSMKDVNQETGEDLTPHLRVKTAEEIKEEEARNPLRSSAYGEVKVIDDSDSNISKVKRLSSPEKWEIKQLIASCVLDQIVRYLVEEHGSNIHQENELTRETVLFNACKSGNHKVVRYLVEQGLDLYKINTNGEIPILIACRYGGERLVRYLVEELYVDLKHQSDTFKELLLKHAKNSNVKLLNYLKKII